MDQYQYIRVLETKMLPGKFCVPRWQWSSTPSTTRHGFPRRWECAAHGLACYITGFEPDREPLVGNLTWIEQDNPPTNVAELTQAVVDIWRDTPDQKLSILVLSMPRRQRRLHEVMSIFFQIAWHDSLALKQGQIFWIWISVLFCEVLCLRIKALFLLVFVTGSKNWQ